MILSKEVEVGWNSSNKSHLLARGYDYTGLRTMVLVKIEDLMPSASCHVKVKCDYCGKDYDAKYGKIIRGHSVIEKDSCSSCKGKKIKESNLAKYGVGNVMHVKEISEHREKYFIENYGSKSPFGSQEVKGKIAETNLVKYGVKNVFESHEFQDKVRNTIREKYGVEYVLQYEEFKNKVTERNTFSISDIQEYVSSIGKAILISTEYIDSNELLRFECECGETFEATFVNFKHENKHQCNKCGIALRSGEKSPMWKGGITPENARIRQSVEYKEWRTKVFQNDNYTCQCCGNNSGGNLRAHHIENFSKYIGKRFDVNNGITLCESCHDPHIIGSFHNIYGTRNNTKEQLEEYIKTYHNKTNDIIAM